MGILRDGVSPVVLGDAEVVAVIDADYVVSPDWLRKMTPHFADETVGFVQSPQDHRDWQDHPFKAATNWEYAGFFDIGMVQRNDHNAIVQHGTMTMIRRAALESVGGWSEWCICEDTELGLRLFVDGMMQANEPSAEERAAVESRAATRGPVEETLASTTAPYADLNNAVFVSKLEQVGAVLDVLRAAAGSGELDAAIARAAERKRTAK